MRIGEGCIQCIYDRETRRTDDEAYLAEIRAILEDWDPAVSAPYFEYLTNCKFKEHFGEIQSYAEIKKEFNDLALSVYDEAKGQVEKDEDPLKTAFFMARIGNYIDFSAMKSVDREDFLKRLFDYKISEADEAGYASWTRALQNAKEFLLIADNSGEIVFDRLMIEEMKAKYPNLHVTVMVRGAEVSNDATMEDAAYVGMDKVATLVSTGIPVAGAIPEMITEEALLAMKNADVILSKGQGNYESLFGQGYHIFFSFLCKCDMFVKHFGVERFTGMIVEEPDAKKLDLFLKQKETLDTFIKHGAITPAQYQKSFGDLKVKMGLEKYCEVHNLG